MTFCQQNLLEMQRLSLIVPRTDKIYRQDFHKVLVLKRSTKEAIGSSFRRAPCTSSSISKISAKI